MTLCCTCRVELTEENAYKKNSKRLQHLCKKCFNKYCADRWRKKKREAVDVKNQADTMIHSAEKNLKEFGDKVSEQERNAIENDIKSLKEASQTDDIENIKKGLEALTQSSMKLGEAMYKAQQQESAQSASPDDSQNDGDTNDKKEKVVDAEFEEVKEDSKQA